VSAGEHVFMLQNCASECVKNRTYRTLQETCDEGASCSSGQGSEALIGSLHFKALPTNRQKTRTCCCSCSCYKILCCNMPFDKNFLRKRACVRPRFKEHCAGRQLHAPHSCVLSHQQPSSQRWATTSCGQLFSQKNLNASRGRAPVKPLSGPPELPMLGL